MANIAIGGFVGAFVPSLIRLGNNSSYRFENTDVQLQALELELGPGDCSCSPAWRLACACSDFLRGAGGLQLGRVRAKVVPGGVFCLVGDRRSLRNASLFYGVVDLSLVAFGPYGYA